MANMNADQIQALGMAIGQAMAAAPRPNEEARQMDIKRNNVRKAASSAPRFTAGTSYLAFETQYLAWRRASGIMEVVRNPAGQDIPVHDAVFQSELLCISFSGQPAERVASISNGTAVWQNTVMNEAHGNSFARFDAFLQEVRGLFMPPSESMMSKAAFTSRRQAADEDIAAYLADKMTFFRQAYNEAQRAQNFEYLREEIIKGVYSFVIKKRLIENPPETVDQLRERAVNFVAQEREKFLMQCSDSTTLDGLAATCRTSYQGNAGVENMEIGAMAANAECWNCGKRGHFAKDCMFPPRDRGNTNALRQTRGGKRAGAASKRDNPNKDLNCYYCGKKGHIRNECRKRQREEQAGSSPQQAPTQGRGGGRGRGCGGRGAARRGGRRQGLKTIPEAEDNEEDWQDGDDGGFLDQPEEDQ